MSDPHHSGCWDQGNCRFEQKPWLKNATLNGHFSREILPHRQRNSLEPDAFWVWADKMEMFLCFSWSGTEIGGSVGGSISSAPHPSSTLRRGQLTQPLHKQKTANGCNLITLFLQVNSQKIFRRFLWVCVETQWGCFQWLQEVGVNVLYWNKNKEPCVGLIKVLVWGYIRLVYSWIKVQITEPEKKMSRSWTIGLLPVVPKNVKRPRERQWRVEKMAHTE